MSFTFELFICNTGAKLHIYIIRDVIFKEKIRRNIHASTFNNIPKGNAYLYYVISKKKCIFADAYYEPITFN